jgi:hypothetical protein
MQIYSASNRNDYQELFLGSKTRLVHKADNLSAICRVNCPGDPGHLTSL